MSEVFPCSAVPVSFLVTTAFCIFLFTFTSRPFNFHLFYLFLHRICFLPTQSCAELTLLSHFIMHITETVWKKRNCLKTLHQTGCSGFPWKYSDKQPPEDQIISRNSTFWPLADRLCRSLWLRTSINDFSLLFPFLSHGPMEANIPVKPPGTHFIYHFNNSISFNRIFTGKVIFNAASVEIKIEQ